MDFRLLGPVEAWSAGRPVDLGSRKQRFVLAVLALEVNRLVPVARLVELTWGDTPPPTARTVIHTHVYRLRSALARGHAHPHGVRLSTAGEGYVLEADPASIDAHRFRALLEQARETSDDDRRVKLLDEALGLWRGPALAAAAPADTRERLCAGLEEARAVALEDRVEARLRLGRHRELLGELMELAQTYPTRERLIGHLVLALYRSGQPGDALRVSREARRRLAEELGLDPGPDLRELEHAILRGDRSLDPPPVPGPPSVPVAAPNSDPVRPAQLPADLALFTGRTAYLAELDALRRARPDSVVIATIAGTAGVGKTALAVHWAHRIAGDFPDGQLYVNLRGFDPAGPPMPPDEAVRGFLDAFNVPPGRIPADPHAQAGLYRSLLAGRRVLVVLDNARDADQVRPLLPGGPGCLTVLTSRDQLTGLIATEGATLIALDRPPVDEARRLLLARLGRLEGRRGADDLPAVDAIVESCARLPLALAIVAARAAAQPTLPLGALADELRAGGPPLDSLAGSDPATDARTVFSWSYQALSPAAAHLFRLIGVHPGPHVTVPAAASLAARPPVEVRSVLAELAGAHLIGEYQPSRFVVHDLLRAYAAELSHSLDGEDERRGAARRLLDHHLHTAHAAAVRLNPMRDPMPLDPPDPAATVDGCTDYSRGMAWFTAEHPVLLALVRQADAAMDADTHLIGLAWTLTVYLDRRGHWHDWVGTQRAALAAARRLGDRRAEAQVHRVLAAASNKLGLGADADVHFRRALDLFDELGDFAGQANTHLSLGQLYDGRGRHDEALRHTERALDLFRAAGDRAGRARALNAIGYGHALLGDHAKALPWCEEALALHQALGDRFSEAATWDSIGYAHHKLGDHARAVECYRRALSMMRDQADRYYESVCLTHLGDVHHAAGDHAAARLDWRAALTILQDLGHVDADAVRAKLGRTD